MLGEPGQPFDLAFGVGRRIDVHLLAELLVPEARLVFAAGRRAVESLAHQRKGGRKRERFGREQNLATRFPLHLRGAREISPQRRDVENVGGRRDRLGPIE